MLNFSVSDLKDRLLQFFDSLSRACTRQVGEGVRQDLLRLAWQSIVRHCIRRFDCERSDCHQWQRLFFSQRNVY